MKRKLVESTTVRPISVNFWSRLIVFLSCMLSKAFKFLFHHITKREKT